MPFPNDDTKFQPGQSGNPGGRPVGHITTFLKEFGNASDIEFTIIKTDVEGTVKKSSSKLSTGDRQTINQAIAARLLQLALNGDLKAIKEVLNRTEGRVPQPINLGGQKDNPLLTAESGKTWVVKDNSGGLPIPDPDDD
ncbi:hypothetical protein GCM10028803_00490 [Larkinella knui]|uniref:DUF5681 domain-containing protein n=1 Tax=Larkinella knui TaxID=2025310 RepID=A0A3P1CJE5_9BACT|nr:DUF5681 domain-containing protein [Larkinella knui]RRB13453.1 hypothetical protein EHT87_14345 [Larkinella knui]